MCLSLPLCLSFLLPFSSILFVFYLFYFIFFTPFPFIPSLRLILSPVITRSYPHPLCFSSPLSVPILLVSFLSFLFSRFSHPPSPFLPAPPLLSSACLLTVLLSVSLPLLSAPAPLPLLSLPVLDLSRLSFNLILSPGIQIICTGHHPNPSLPTPDPLPLPALPPPPPPHLIPSLSLNPKAYWVVKK